MKTIAGPGSDCALTRDSRLSNEYTAPSIFDISFHQIAETANDIILVTTADLDAPGPFIVYANPAFYKLTGYTPAEVVGRSPRILQGPGTSRQTLDGIREALRQGRPVHEKILNYAKTGAPYWLDARIVPLRDFEGRITHFAAIERDVTLDKRRLDELEFAADRDTLTGIPNRRALLRRSEAEIEAALARQAGTPDGRGVCMAFMDIDHFKSINDNLGHATGDAVLFNMADRLLDNVRRSDMVGRIGGEEFAVCMPAVSLHEAGILAERLRTAIAAAPFDTPCGPVPLTISVGVSAFHDGDSLASLMERADLAMYASKRNGRNQVTTQR